MKKGKTHNSVQTFYIDGMHCASCEVLIEKTLLENPTVSSVNASLRDATVHIVSSGSKPITREYLNATFAETGYTFQTKKKKAQKEPFIHVTETGAIAINSAKLQSLGKSIALVALLVLVFVLVEKMELGSYISVSNSSSLSGFFALGFVAGISSCAALVGGLLLSLVKQWNELYITESNILKRSTPHFLFHIGRILAYTVLGGVLGILGETIALFDNKSIAFIIIVVSLIMVVSALQMLEVPWAQKIRFSAPKQVTRQIANEKNFKGKYLPFLVGMGTFFLPCGFTLTAQGIALTSGSFLSGATILLFFSLGTLVPLILISVSGVVFNTKPQLTAKFNAVAGSIILFFALYNVNAQLNVLGLPSLNDLSLPSLTEQKQSTETQFAPINERGIQELNLVASGFRYTATSPTTLKAGIPTVLKIEDKGIRGCGAYVSAVGLIPDYIVLNSGINTIEFTPKKGTYKITCTMGMVPPVPVIVK